MTAFYYEDYTAAIVLAMFAVVGHVISMFGRTNGVFLMCEVTLSAVVLLCGYAGLIWGKGRTKSVMALGVACATLHAVVLYALCIPPSTGSDHWLGHLVGTPLIIKTDLDTSSHIRTS